MLSLSRTWTCSALVLALLGLVATPALACPGTRLPSLIAAESLGKLAEEFPTSDHQTGEGSAWRIYLGTQSGKPVNIVRANYGENGKLETRLVIAAPQAYAIVETPFRYSTSVADPNMEILPGNPTIWMFCKGELQRPKGLSAAALAGHRAAASNMQALFRDPDIAKYLGGLLNL